MENGVSTKIQAIQTKLGDSTYLDKAVKIISEQLVYFFYSEWKEKEI